SYGAVPAMRTLLRAPDGFRLPADYYDGDANFEKSDRKSYSLGWRSPLLAAGGLQCLHLRAARRKAHELHLAFVQGLVLDGGHQIVVQVVGGGRQETDLRPAAIEQHVRDRPVIACALLVPARDRLGGGIAHFHLSLGGSRGLPRFRQATDPNGHVRVIRPRRHLEPLLRVRGRTGKKRGQDGQGRQDPQTKKARGGGGACGNSKRWAHGLSVDAIRQGVQM
ncbi:hypothetical protein BMR85_028460, partial [Achromobacter sp. KAs 3-5]